MQIIVKAGISEFLIDDSVGMVWQLYTAIVKKETVTKYRRFKSFSKIAEAYEYLEQVGRVPVWKIKSSIKKVEKEIKV